MNKYYNYKNKVCARPAGSDQPRLFKGLKAEQYDMLGGRYAITINPEDNRNTIKDTINDYQSVKDHIKSTHQDNIQNIFKNLKYCEVLLYPELSPTGRLHYHGVLTVIDTIQFLWHDVQIIREHAQCEIDTIKEMKVWEEYISKQYHLMKEYIEILHIKNRKTESL